MSVWRRLCPATTAILASMFLLPARVARAESNDEWVEPAKREPKGLLGPFRIGPLIGFGLPNLLNAGVTLKVTRYFGAGVNIGVIPTLRIAQYGDAKLSFQEYDAYARVYPLGNGWYLGSGVGYAHARGSLKKTTDISSYAWQYPELNLPNALHSSSHGSVEAMVLTPQVGYFQIFRGGFCVGADIGMQVPIAKSHTSVSTRVAESVPAEATERVISPGEAEVEHTLRRVARLPIPAFNVRFGWML